MMFIKIDIYWQASMNIRIDVGQEQNWWWWWWGGGVSLALRLSQPSLAGVRAGAELGKK